MSWEMILGMTLPSLMVFLAVYYTMKQYHEQQTKMNLLSNRQVNDKVILPLKLQAYERLILLCERINIADLLLRLKAPGTSGSELKSALLLAVQQEFEHNLTQQLYVSEELWQVLLAMKARTMDLIIQASDGLSSEAPAESYAMKLISLASTETNQPSRLGIKAIKTESSLWA
ncbi:MAG: hypothetical protein ABIQ02_04050 [Saprospiraceae bacterium]